MLRRVRATFAPAETMGTTGAGEASSSSKRVKRDGGPDECSDDDELEVGQPRAYFTTGKGALKAFLRRIAGVAAVEEDNSRGRSAVVLGESSIRGVTAAEEDVLVKEYVADAFEPSQPYLETTTQYDDGERRETNETADRKSVV